MNIWGFWDYKTKKQHEDLNVDFSAAANTISCELGQKKKKDLQATLGFCPGGSDTLLDQSACDVKTSVCDVDRVCLFVMCDCGGGLQGVIGGLACAGMYFIEDVSLHARLATITIRARIITPH